MEGRTMHTYLLDLDKRGELKTMISSGLASICIWDWMSIKQTHEDASRTMKNSEAVKFTADQYNVSDQQVYKVLKMMKKKV